VTLKKLELQDGQNFKTEKQTPNKGVIQHAMLANVNNKLHLLFSVLGW